MNKKRYFILLIPTVIVFLSLVFWLPEENKFYALFTPVVFWIIYYGLGLKGKLKNQ